MQEADLLGAYRGYCLLDPLVDSDGGLLEEAHDASFIFLGSAAEG